ncbi:MAG: hypothetical protein DMG53_28410 [Acidobacteria bacterium]|nr:MAG: hypothetical protein DMG53_28410 [Acidobacteriota bacterium]
MRYQHAGLLVFLTLAASGSSQTFRGAINGSVTDPTEGVVPKAAVVVENIATGIKHTTFTTPEGQFVFHSSYRQASAPKSPPFFPTICRAAQQVRNGSCRDGKSVACSRFIPDSLSPFSLKPTTRVRTSLFSA